MEKIGQLLRNEREKRRLSLHEIGMSLKINPKILQAIEENDEAKLPAKTFLRGFVRSYAQFLRLNVDQILNQLQEEIGSTKPQIITAPLGSPEKTDGNESQKSNTETSGDTSSQSAVDKSPKETSQQPSPNKTPLRADRKAGVVSQNQVIVGLVVVILSVSIFIVSKLIDRYQKEKLAISPEEIPVPIEHSAATSPTTVGGDQRNQATSPNPTTTEPSGAATKMEPIPGQGGSSIPQDGQVTKMAEPKLEKWMSKEIPDFPGVELVRPERKKPSTIEPAKEEQTVAIDKPKDPTAPPVGTMPVKKVEPDPVVKNESRKNDPPISDNPTVVTTEKPSPDDLAKTIEALAQVKPTEVILEALNPISVRYHFGDGAWKNLALESGSFHTFKGQASLKMEVSDGGSVNLIVNGRDRGVPGQIGKPITLSYPK